MHVPRAHLPPLATEPLVSVCIPAHDVERFVAASVASVLAQTYRRLEVIVVDDASSDATADVLSRMSDARLRVVRAPRNLGAANATNVAVSLARGDLVAIYHADDLYEPSIVEKEVESFHRHPDVGGVFTGNRMIREDGRVIGTNRIPRELAGREVFDYETVFRFVLRNKNILLCTPSFMGRRDVLEALGPFTEEPYHVAYDFEMWLRLLRRHPIAVVDEPLMSYRHSTTQYSARSRRLRTTEEKFFLIMDEYARNDPRLAQLTAADWREYEFHRVDDCTVRAANAVMLGQPSDAAALLGQRRYPWRSLLARPARRKLRVLLMRAALRTALVLHATRLLGPVLTVTEASK